MRNIPRIMLAGSLAAALAAWYFSGETHTSVHPSENHVTAAAENISREENLILQAKQMIRDRYSLDINITVLIGQEMGDDLTAGRAFYRLGTKETDMQDFISFYGLEMYQRLEESDVVVLRPLSYYGTMAGSDDPQYRLWNSLYMPDPNADLLYKRAVLHEVGHILFYGVDMESVKSEFAEIDINSGAYLGGSEKEHPAHASFYSYFLCIAPGFEGELLDRAVSEAWSEIFALDTLGLLGSSQDEYLNSKIEIMHEALLNYSGD